MMNSDIQNSNRCQFSLCRALSAMDTLRSFKLCGAKGVYRQISCQGITRPSAVPYRLTQTTETPQKINRNVRVTNIKRKGRKR